MSVMYRTFSREIFTDEAFVTLSPMAKLCFFALELEADREGRMRWNPATLKWRFFPANASDMTEVTDELIAAGLVNTYEVNGEEYAEIQNFKRYQVINGREAASKLPSPPSTDGGDDEF